MKKRTSLFVTGALLFSVTLHGEAGTAGFQSSTTAMTACPSQDFDGFLKRFANDVDVQKAFVTTPLQSEYIDPEAQPEPRPVPVLLKKSQLKFPLMPSDKQQRDQGLTLAKQLERPDQAIIKLTKVDTDYQFSLFFKREACWMLYRIQDESL